MKTLAIIGIIGGLLCAAADLLLDLKGTDNKKLGKMGIIDSAWSRMPHWRFVASDILAMFAVPMYTCGFIALMMKLPVRRYGRLYDTYIFVFTAYSISGNNR